MADDEHSPDARSTNPEPARADGGPSADRSPKRRREPVFNIPPVVIAFIAICVILELVRTQLLTPEQDFELIVRTAFIPIRYSGQVPFELWAVSSPLTYSLLHGGYLHLGLNMIWLAAFGTPLANRIGPARFVGFWAVTSVAAAAAHYALHSGEAVPLVGASGAISGMMGIAARYGFRTATLDGRGIFWGPILPIRVALTMRPVITFLAIWFVINFATGILGMPGMDAAIAWEAHVGGFAAGFLLAGLFDRPITRPYWPEEDIEA